jgi:hypothetical protein
MLMDINVGFYEPHRNIRYQCSPMRLIIQLRKIISGPLRIDAKVALIHPIYGAICERLHISLGLRNLPNSAAIAYIHRASNLAPNSFKRKPIERCCHFSSVTSREDSISLLNKTLICVPNSCPRITALIS